MTDQESRLASADFFRHYSPVTEKDVTGFSSLSGAAISRTAFALRLFHCHRASSFGRRGVGSLTARRCSTGLLTRTSVAHPFSSGKAVTHRNWSKQMQNFHINGDDLDKVTLRISLAQSNLVALGIALSGDGGSPSGETLNGALGAVAELLDTINDILVKVEVCHG